MSKTLLSLDNGSGGAVDAFCGARHHPCYQCVADLATSTLPKMHGGVSRKQRRTLCPIVSPLVPLWREEALLGYVRRTSRELMRRASLRQVKCHKHRRFICPVTAPLYTLCKRIWTQAALPQVWYRRCTGCATGYGCGVSVRIRPDDLRRVSSPQAVPRLHLLSWRTLCRSIM